MYVNSLVMLFDASMETVFSKDVLIIQISLSLKLHCMSLWDCGLIFIKILELKFLRHAKKYIGKIGLNHFIALAETISLKEYACGGVIKFWVTAFFTPITKLLL